LLSGKWAVSQLPDVTTEPTLVSVNFYNTTLHLVCSYIVRLFVRKYH